MKLPKPTLVPIESIVISRELEPNDDLTELAHSIEDFPGLARPVSIDKESNLLIDGLRRIRAMQQLGYGEIPVIATETFEDTCDLHKRVRTHGVAALPVTPRRIWQFYQATERQRHSRTNALRRRTWDVREQATPSRILLTDAVGASSEAMLTATLALYKRALTEKDQQRREFTHATIAAMERGEITLFQARTRVFVRDPYGLYGDINTATDQRRLLSTAIDQIAGTNTGLRSLGELSPELSQDELRAYIKGLEQQRASLHNFINLLRKRVTN